MTFRPPTVITGTPSERLGHATITMTQRYAVYAPPIASVHYQAALNGMGMAGDSGLD